MHRASRLLISIALGFGGLLLAPAPTFATTGNFTLPFFDPNVNLTQGYGCTGVVWEPAYGSCAHYHNGHDYGISYGPIAAARAGVVVGIDVTHPDRAAGDCPAPGTFPPGNYILISHPANRWTVYYHLKQNGAAVVLGQKVAGGQLIGTSGNSGTSCGAHLHYSLATLEDPTPSAGSTLDPDGRWTTADSGRVPWLARFVSESDTGTLFMTAHSTVTYWVKFRNKGGRDWLLTNPLAANEPADDHRVYFGATTSNGKTARSSGFDAPDWETTSIITVADGSVKIEPDQIGTFTFGVHAGLPAGSYTEYFNFWADLVNDPNHPTPGGVRRFFWLRDVDANDISSFSIPITILNKP